MRKLGQVCRGRGGWGRDTSLHPPPLQVWPGCAPSSSLPPFPGALQFRLGCLSCPLPPFGTARLVVIKAFRPPLRAQPRGARVGPPWPGGGGPRHRASSSGLPEPGPGCRMRGPAQQTHQAAASCVSLPHFPTCRRSLGVASAGRRAPGTCWGRQRPLHPPPGSSSWPAFYGRVPQTGPCSEVAKMAQALSCWPRSSPSLCGRLGHIPPVPRAAGRSGPKRKRGGHGREGVVWQAGLGDPPRAVGSATQARGAPGST